MNKDVNTIEILAEEIVEALDPSLKDDVIMLSENLGENKMLPLNPLVTKYNELQKIKELKYDPDNKDETVKDYTEAWKEIRSFRATVKGTKKDMKANVLKIGKALDNIEKTFVDGATDIMDTLEKNFKVYLDEKEEIKRKREEKKDAARLSEIAKLEEEKNEALEKAAKAGAFNYLKYDLLHNWKDECFSQSSKWNKETLEAGLQDLKVLKLNDLINGANLQPKWGYLEPEEQMELFGLFQSFRNDIHEAYAERINQIEEKAKLALPYTEQTIAGPPPPPLPVSGTFIELGKSSLKDAYQYWNNALQNLHDNDPKFANMEAFVKTNEILAHIKNAQLIAEEL